LTIVTILLAVALLVGFWFIKNAEPLRFVVVSLEMLLCPFIITNHIFSSSSA